MSEPKKKSRRVDHEYELAARAARGFTPLQAPDFFSWQKSAFEHGYVQALLDVQDGKVKP